jgi:hypothetical protein
MENRPSTAPSPSPKYASLASRTNSQRPKSSVRKARLSTRELARLREKYDRQSTEGKWLYGVKMDTSVGTSIYDELTLPSTASTLKNIPGGLRGKTQTQHRKNPMSANVGPIAALPRPSSPEVVTMMKTMLLRGGIEAPSAPNPNADPTAYATNKITTLYDEQASHILKLKIKSGDKSAKKQLQKFMEIKNRTQAKSLDLATWEDHLPSYARHAVSKKTINPLEPDPLSVEDPSANMSALEKKQATVQLILEHIKTQPSTHDGLKGKSCMEPAVNKVRCALCQMFFEKKSMGGCISMKSVMELQREWGVVMESKKFKAASFMYTQVKLCVFCSQQFSTKSRLSRKFGKKLVDDRVEGAGDLIKNDIQLASLIAARELSDIKDYNLAVIGTAAQSSTVDGKLATLAISGRLGPAPPEMCTRTRREFEPWWEVTLDASYPIKAVVVYTRSDPEGSTASYKLPPFWIFVTDEAQGTDRLAEVKRKAIKAACVYSDNEKIVWKLPPNTCGANVRVQAEGIKSLQVAQVEIQKGGLVLDKNGEPAETAAPSGGATTGSGGMGMSMAMTTFEYDVIGRPKLNSTMSRMSSANLLSSPQGTPLRPSTANAASLGSPSPFSPIAPRPTTSFATTRPPDPKIAAPPKQSVSSLITTTGSAFRHKQNQLFTLNKILGSFNDSELDALRRNFLLFAECDKGLVPRKTGETMEYWDKMEVMVDDHRLTISQCAGALAAVKSAGPSGPKSRNKKAFGFWEKEYHHWEDDDSGNYHTASSKAYIELIESYCIDDLGPALLDVEYARKMMKGLPNMSISWFEYVNVVKCCMAKNLQLLAKVFNVPKDMIASRTDGMQGTAGDDESSLETSTVDGSPMRPSSGASRTNAFDMTGTTMMDRPSRREMKPTPPCLSLSQSLKHYDNASATFAASPAAHRKPKLTNTGKTKLERSEEIYTSMLERLENTVDPDLTGMEYVLEIEERQRRMQEIHSQARTPDVNPKLNRKNCSLCLLSFPIDAINSSVTVKNLKSLSKKWKVEFQKFGEGVPEAALLMQHRIPVCSFCSQFFDPDSHSGLASYKKKKRVNYLPFFDDAFPQLFSNVEIPDFQSEFVVTARKRSHYAVLEKMAAYEGLLKDDRKYTEDEKIRMAEQSSLATSNSREDHENALNEWSEQVEHKAEELQHYNPSKLTLRAESMRTESMRTDSMVDMIEQSNKDDSLEPRSWENLDGDSNEGKINEEDGDGLMTNSMIEEEDAKYMDEHKLNFNDTAKSPKGINSALRGTVRVDHGRKVASTGISIYEFSANHEKEQADKIIYGSGRNSPQLGAFEEKEEEGEEGGDGVSMDGSVEYKSVN